MAMLGIPALTAVAASAAAIDTAAIGTALAGAAGVAGEVGLNVGANIAAGVGINAAFEGARRGINKAMRSKNKTVHRFGVKSAGIYKKVNNMPTKLVAMLGAGYGITKGMQHLGKGVVSSGLTKSAISLIRNGLTHAPVAI